MLRTDTNVALLRTLTDAPLYELGICRPQQSNLDDDEVRSVISSCAIRCKISEQNAWNRAHPGWPVRQPDRREGEFGFFS